MALISTPDAVLHARKDLSVPAGCCHSNSIEEHFQLSVAGQVLIIHLHSSCCIEFAFLPMLWLSAMLAAMLQLPSLLYARNAAPTQSGQIVLEKEELSHPLSHYYTLQMLIGRLQDCQNRPMYPSIVSSVLPCMLTACLVLSQTSIHHAPKGSPAVAPRHERRPPLLYPRGGGCCLKQQVL